MGTYKAIGATTAEEGQSAPNAPHASLHALRAAMRGAAATTAEQLAEARAEMRAEVREASNAVVSMLDEATTSLDDIERALIDVGKSIEELALRDPPVINVAAPPVHVAAKPADVRVETGPVHVAAPPAPDVKVSVIAPLWPFVATMVFAAGHLALSLYATWKGL